VKLFQFKAFIHWSFISVVLDNYIYVCGWWVPNSSTGKVFDS